MNIDRDTQYAFTRPIADHMLKNYDGGLKPMRGGRGRLRMLDTPQRLLL
jgi:hypothetical protein